MLWQLAAQHAHQVGCTDASIGVCIQRAESYGCILKPLIPAGGQLSMRGILRCLGWSPEPISLQGGAEDERLRHLQGLGCNLESPVPAAGRKHEGFTAPRPGVLDQAH